MTQLKDIATLQCGSPQFRIKESHEEGAELYFAYGQPELECDLCGCVLGESQLKPIKTSDSLATLSENDVVFSLVSGRASMVSRLHDGYMFTQNFVNLNPSEKLDSKFLVFLLNEDPSILRQLATAQQGTQVLKHSVSVLGALEIPRLPSLSSQQLIGALYFNQRKLEALKTRVAKNEALITLHKIKEAAKL